MTLLICNNEGCSWVGGKRAANIANFQYFSFVKPKEQISWIFAKVTCFMRAEKIHNGKSMLPPHSSSSKTTDTMTSWGKRGNTKRHRLER